MANQCKICSSPDAGAVNAELASGAKSNRALAKQFGFSEAGIRRHRHCLEGPRDATDAPSVAVAAVLDVPKDAFLAELLGDGAILEGSARQVVAELLVEAPPERITPSVRARARHALRIGAQLGVSPGNAALVREFRAAIDDVVDALVPVAAVGPDAWREGFFSGLLDDVESRRRLHRRVRAAAKDLGIEGDGLRWLMLAVTDESPRLASDGTALGDEKLEQTRLPRRVWNGEAKEWVYPPAPDAVPVVAVMPSEW